MEHSIMSLMEYTKKIIKGFSNKATAIILMEGRVCIQTFHRSWKRLRIEEWRIKIQMPEGREGNY
jgi:hypothetical protein